jgi:hypothetical protein
VRAFQGVLGSGELLKRVSIRARGPRGIKRALRLLYFLIGRFTAARRGGNGQDGDQREHESTRQRHCCQYTTEGWGAQAGGAVVS